MSGGGRARAAPVLLLATALLLVEGARAVRAESRRLTQASFEHRLHLLRTGADARLNDVLGPLRSALAAVGELAPDATRLVVVAQETEADVLAVARLTSLLYPIEVRKLAQVPQDAGELSAWAGPTSYVLHLDPARLPASVRGLTRLGSGEGWLLLHAAGDG